MNELSELNGYGFFDVCVFFESANVKDLFTLRCDATHNITNEKKIQFKFDLIIRPKNQPKNYA